MYTDRLMDDVTVAETETLAELLGMLNEGVG